MVAEHEGRLLSARHCSACIPETPIVCLTGVTNGRVFAFCVDCTLAMADPPSQFRGGRLGRAEVLSRGKARAATERVVDEHCWFLDIEGTVPKPLMAVEPLFVNGRWPSRG